MHCLVTHRHKHQLTNDTLESLRIADKKVPGLFSSKCVNLSFTSAYAGLETKYYM